MPPAFVIGVDFGTDSVRAVLTDGHTGAEAASSVFVYPRWREGLYCQPSFNQFRQHPLDHIEGLEATITDCLKKAGPGAAAQVKAISIDTTGSTPIAVDRNGTPLSLQPAFRNNPNAMFVLWKDHTAIAEAEAINRHAEKYSIDYLRFAGGIYSSEWFWAKWLHILRVDEAIRYACYSWVEHCDWIPFLLTGGTDIHAMKRSACAAGHKALWSESLGGLPPDDFFFTLDPLLKNCTARLYHTVYTADQPAGQLSSEWARRLGLTENVIIGAGAFDAHMGAVGGQIEPYYLSKVMGTSTCDMLVAPLEETRNKMVKGICGQVPGSIIPGMLGMEAGQSAFGDVYAWLKKILLWPIEQFIEDESLKRSIADQLLYELAEEAALLPVTEHDELAIDWLNGRRTPNADQLLKGAIRNLTLSTGAVQLFRSLVEATCFGAKAIVDQFIKEGIGVKGLIGLGGVAKKSPYIMQVMADVTGMPIRIHKTEHTCAAGAAMFAATVAGIYPDVTKAMQAMGQGFETTYHADGTKAGVYAGRYERYGEMGAFIEATRGGRD
jgi:L-ribulokinase